jgi:hypothetical protein
MHLESTSQFNLHDEMAMGVLRCCIHVCRFRPTLCSLLFLLGAAPAAAVKGSNCRWVGRGLWQASMAGLQAPVRTLGWVRRLTIKSWMHALGPLGRHHSVVGGCQPCIRSSVREVHHTFVSKGSTASGAQAGTGWAGRGDEGNAMKSWRGSRIEGPIVSSCVFPPPLRHH